MTKCACKLSQWWHAPTKPCSPVSHSNILPQKPMISKLELQISGEDSGNDPSYITFTLRALIYLNLLLHFLLCIQSEKQIPSFLTHQATTNKSAWKICPLTQGLWRTFTVVLLFSLRFNWTHVCVCATKTAIFSVAQPCNSFSLIKQTMYVNVNGFCSDWLALSVPRSKCNPG